MSDIVTIEGSISFIDRVRHLDVPQILQAKETGTHWFGRKDIACVSIGPVTIWVEATMDGKSNIGLYRQFLDRRQRAELKRLNATMIEFATKHGVEKQVLAANGSDPQIEKR